MDHDTLDRLRQVHPAWRILVADHAPLVLSFLTLAFIQPNRRAIPAPEIAAHLDAYLDQLRETYPERYPRSARDYLEDWAAPNRAYLRKYYPKSGPDAEFDLTPATEKAIEWLQTLAPQQFIGTESRLLTLFQLLRDLAAGAQDDPSARIRDLTRRRDDIEREIERVREGRAGPLDATQVKERYAQVADTARRLLADFRQVEENFRVLDSQTRERIATSTQPKGALLEEIFGETDHIHRSDQGKSFDAFWEFLMSPARQDELREWLRAVHALEAIRDLPREDFVRNIPPMLLDAGDKVHGTVAQLVDQLRRFVDDQAHLENRRILDLIHEIESHAIALKATHSRDSGIRTARWFRTGNESCDVPRIIQTAAQAGAGPRRQSRRARRSSTSSRCSSRPRSTRSCCALMSTSYSRSAPKSPSRKWPNAYPPQQGLAEIVTYLRIASHEGAAVDETIKDTIIIPGAGPASPFIRDGRPDKHVRVPRVIFTR